MEMPEIKRALSSAFGAVGYTTSVSNLTRLNFECNGYRGVCAITSANARKYEITVHGQPGCLTVPARPSPNGDVFASKRFNKNADTIPHALEWLATAHSGHQHLYELLHPEAQTPEFMSFADGNYVYSSDTAYCGLLSSATVVGLVSIVDRKVFKEAVYDPATKAYFMVQLYFRSHGGRTIITDGISFLPVTTLSVNGQIVYRIFTYEDYVATYHDLNQADRALIHAAVRHYIDTNIHMPHS